ncbi:UNVERIFIED_CONTAM: hypothetical protein DES50_11357 [Williamsia faeni]
MTNVIETPRFPDNFVAMLDGDVGALYQRNTASFDETPEPPADPTD